MFFHKMLAYTKAINKTKGGMTDVWIVNTKLNNFFKGVLTVLNWR